VSGDSDGRDQRLVMLHRVVKEHQIAGAVEDGPPARRAELTGQDAGPDRRSLLERVLDEIADAALDSYGDLETVPLGAVQPTPEQRAATLDKVARQEKGQPE
jgi:hypothetical protein